ncbi:MAG: PTS-dependent dihydroxyacetone kinase phosphotransferase subunit DhaM [Cryobacterium sp.]|uniref:dihydroxyacetone kinase phosphoryl donor subunit DhaM n=1 Tax=unclassified Cryobacterium TaxID=2649013 RepID=UPI0018CABE99|nr:MULTISPECIES: dihydroxyacetone kinase phosphoryl donor subunit DhaM [unclassified Cryobacterium]MCY7404372.1 PTS-dependent dihydroxyacetone kinase phosphotransferase subunit DhaM [Cryobacterium sp.]MEC5154665.1 PTS hybrid protein [Cryobacterium sp. CAN_C3]
MAAAPADRVGLVFVSHSEKISTGLVDLARQMAPTVHLIAAGGTDSGGIGTSFEKISDAIVQANTGGGVVILCDLGSAILTAETAHDFLAESERHRVRIVDAPLVEGGVAAAVAAETGGDLNAVVAAAQTALRTNSSTAFPAGDAPQVVTATLAAGAISRTVTLINKDGLHARPAAEFVNLASSFSVPITVNGTDARSLLSIMSLGLVRGSSVQLASPDPSAGPAINALANLLESGFDEE